MDNFGKLNFWPHFSIVSVDGVWKILQAHPGPQYEAATLQTARQSPLACCSLRTGNFTLSTTCQMKT